MTDAKLIMAGLPPKETFVRESPQPPFAIDLSKLTSVERNVLKTAREGASIAALALGTGIDKGRALRACYALLSAGLLEPTIDPADPGPLAGTRTTEQAVRKELARLDEPAAYVFGVEPSAQPVILKVAYQMRRDEWENVRSQLQDAALIEQVDEILFRLAAAYHQLVSRDSPEPLAVAPVKPVKLVETVDAVPVESPSPVAFEELPEPPVPSSPPPTQTPDEEPPPPAVKSDPTDYQRSNRIIQLERDAKIHIAAKDWNGAISLLHELVTLEPENGGHRGLLAKAMRHHPIMRRNAEQHFLEALRLSPRNVELHLELANFYLKHLEQRDAPVSARYRECVARAPLGR